MPPFSWDNTTASFINLDWRHDRCQHMFRECARVGLKATRVPACVPSNYRGDPANIAAMLARPQKGAIGCWMSQRSVLWDAMRGDKNVLVLEDDVVFCDDLRERFDYLEKRLPAVDAGWDIVSLGGCFHIPAEWHKSDALGRDAECTSDPRIMRVYGAWFTWAWVVRRESIAKVMGLLDEIGPQAWGIDHAIILLGDRLRSYCFVPGMSKQMDGQSDIGSGETRFSGFASLGPYWFQPLMTDLDPSTFDWKDAKR